MPATLPICRRTWTSAEPAAARSRGSAAERTVLPAEERAADPGPDEDRPRRGQPVPAVHPDPRAEQEPQRPDDETAYPEHPRPEPRQQHHRQPKPDEEAHHHRHRCAGPYRARPRRGRRAGTAARRTSRRRTPGWRPPPSGRPTGTPAAATAPGRRPARRRGRVAATTRTPANDAAPPTSPASTSGSVHPRSGPSMTPYVAASIPTEVRSMPTRSSRRPRAPTVSGRNSRTATRASAMTGRLTTNTEPHQKCWSSTPATIGPNGSPTIVEMPSVAIARVRSSASNSTTTDDIASGMRTAAPTPSSVRAAMRLSALVDSAHQSDPSEEQDQPDHRRALPSVPVAEQLRPAAATHREPAGSCPRTTGAARRSRAGSRRCRAGRR